MTLYTILLIWYSIGAAGCTLGTLADLSRGIDFTFVDLILSAIISLFGPISFILGLCAYCSDSSVTSPTLIKGKK